MNANNPLAQTLARIIPADVGGAPQHLGSGERLLPPRQFVPHPDHGDSFDGIHQPHKPSLKRRIISSSSVHPVGTRFGGLNR